MKIRRKQQRNFLQITPEYPGKKSISSYRKMIQINEESVGFLLEEGGRVGVEEVDLGVGVAAPEGVLGCQTLYRTIKVETNQTQIKSTPRNGSHLASC